MRISEYERAGSLTLINVGRKHADKLAAHANPVIQERADAVLTGVSNLQNAFAARAPLAALAKSATALKVAKDVELDAFVSSLSYDLLAPAVLNRNRAAPEYRALFPQGNLAFLASPEPEELAVVASMVAYLKRNPAHPMASRADDLAAKAAALDATLGPQAAAEMAIRNASDVEATKRAELFRLLRKSVSFLRDQFEGDEKQVDAMFPSLAEARDPNDEPPPA